MNWKKAQIWLKKDWKTFNDQLQHFPLIHLKINLDCYLSATQYKARVETLSAEQLNRMQYFWEMHQWLQRCTLSEADQP